MKKMISRRLFVASALSGLGGMAFGGSVGHSLRPVLRPNGIATIATKRVGAADAVVEQARLGGRVAFSVADVATGQVLEARQSKVGLPPASVTKAVTALYALETLGAGYRFRTRLVANGPVRNGVLNGDLILVGGGDPTLNTDALAAMAADLKKAGVREVRGKFLVSNGDIPNISEIDKGQPDHVGYNPALAGLSLNFNRVYFEWKRAANGWSVQMDARTEKYRPEVQTARMRIVDRKLPVYTYKKAGNRDDWTVAKHALGKGGGRWLPVRNPALYAGDVFRTFARSHGIVLSAAKISSVAVKGDTIVSHSSPPLTTILRGMLKYSNNMTAELVGLGATLKRSGRVNGLRGSAQEMNRWATQALGMSNARLVDHSGLGPESRLTAADMTSALVRVRAEGALRPILKAIPLRRKDGKINKAHPVKVYAKTGTLNFVSGLAGYMVAQDGTELAFAIFAVEENARAKLKRADRERPKGARGWNKRAKVMQQALIERWGMLYGS